MGLPGPYSTYRDSRMWSTPVPSPAKLVTEPQRSLLLQRSESLPVAYQLQDYTQYHHHYHHYHHHHNHHRPPPMLPAYNNTGYPHGSSHYINAHTVRNGYTNTSVGTRPWNYRGVPSVVPPSQPRNMVVYKQDLNGRGMVFGVLAQPNKYPGYYHRRHRGRKQVLRLISLCHVHTHRSVIRCYKQ